VSYSLATVVVVVVGILREVTGNWQAALWLMFAIAIASSLAGVQLAKKRFVDDELTA
jgi:cyanate permease